MDKKYRQSLTDKPPSKDNVINTATQVNEEAHESGSSNFHDDNMENFVLN